MESPTALAIAAISAVVAALTSLIGLWSFRSEQLNQKITVAKWKREYFEDLLRWSDEAILVLSEAYHLCELDPKRMEANQFFYARHALLIKLSAQIDRGRWFFPNYATDQHGQHKPEAYQGYRHAVLDGLVNAYREVSRIDYVDSSKNRERQEAIREAKRHFTSEIQKALDPRSRDVEFRRLVTEASSA